MPLSLEFHRKRLFAHNQLVQRCQSGQAHQNEEGIIPPFDRFEALDLADRHRVRRTACELAQNKPRSHQKKNDCGDEAGLRNQPLQKVKGQI